MKNETKTKRKTRNSSIILKILELKTFENDKIDNFKYLDIIGNMMNETYVHFTVVVFVSTMP